MENKTENKIITDQKLKERLAVTCDNQPFIAKTPMVLIFCAGAQKWYDAYLAAGLNPRKPAEGAEKTGTCADGISAAVYLENFRY